MGSCNKGKITGGSAPYSAKKTGKPTGRFFEVIAASGMNYTLEEILVALPAEEAPARVVPPLASSSASPGQGKLPPRSVAEVEDAAQLIPRQVREQGTRSPRLWR
jgi:hypothetical protein